MIFRKRVAWFLMLTAVLLTVTACRKKSKAEPDPVQELLDTIEALETETEYPSEKKIWDAADDTLAGWAESFDVEHVVSAAYVIQGEEREEFAVTDKNRIRELFEALDEVTVTEKTDGYAPEEGDIFTFEMDDGETVSIGFCLSCFTWERIIYETQNTDRLWEVAEAIINSGERITESSS